jgi:hypothetical protein
MLEFSLLQESLLVMGLLFMLGRILQLLPPLESRPSSSAIPSYVEVARVPPQPSAGSPAKKTPPEGTSPIRIASLVKIGPMLGIPPDNANLDSKPSRVPAHEKTRSNLDRSSRKKAKHCFKCGERGHFASTCHNALTVSPAFVATR